MHLTNGDIFQALEPLRAIMEPKFPVTVSSNLVKLAMKLNEPFKVIEEVRNGLIKKYGETDERGRTQVQEDSESFPKFVAEFNELMALEVEPEIVFEKVKLPVKVASTCDKCHHNMDRELEIEPKILMALDKFVEVG